MNKNKKIFSVCKFTNLVLILVTTLTLTIQIALKTPTFAEESKEKNGINNLIPYPTSVIEGADTDNFIINDNTVIRYSEKTENTAIDLGNLIQESTGVILELSEDLSIVDNSILLEVDASILKKESYTLTINNKTVIIKGSDSAGVFYGYQTLRQLLPVFVNSSIMNKNVVSDITLPAVQIEDSPRFGYRGMMMDVARSFLTVDELKELIDNLAMSKINVLHLHLSDDQGWRIEITNEGKSENDPIDYTLLTEISGKTTSTPNSYTYGQLPGVSGYYTQDDFKVIVAYADRNHIEIIPEIDVPGHTNAALHAIPELNTKYSSHEGTPEKPTADANGSVDVGYSYLDPESDVTYMFVEHVFKQIHSMTNSDYVHVGGDEPLKMTQVLGHEKFAEFVQKTLNIMADNDIKVMGWLEIAETDLVPGSYVQYWSGNKENLIEQVEKGNALTVLSPGKKTYLDMRQNKYAQSGLSWACYGNCNYDSYYDWDTIDYIEDKYTVGLEAPLFSETVRGIKSAQNMIYPRLLSTAEKAWTNPDNAEANLESFLKRLINFAPTFTANDINFYDKLSDLENSRNVKFGYDYTGLENTAGNGVVTKDNPIGVISAPGATVIDNKLVADLARNTNSKVGTDGITYTINWGDGETSAATLEATLESGPINSNGIINIFGEHTYEKAGLYDGKILASDGSERDIKIIFDGITLEVTLTDLNGNPVEGVDVVISTSSEEVETVTSNNEGKVTFKYLNQGTSYSLNIISDQYEVVDELESFELTEALVSMDMKLKKVVVEEISTEKLEATLEKAKAFDLKLYTVESGNRLRTAINEAEVLLDRVEKSKLDETIKVSQIEINEAEANLQNALDSLVKIDGDATEENNINDKDGVNTGINNQKVLFTIILGGAVLAISFLKVKKTKNTTL